MKPKIEVGVWKTIGGQTAHVRKTAELLSWGCVLNVEGGSQVAWSSKTLDTHDPLYPDWDLLKRVGDLPKDDDDFIFASSKPKMQIQKGFRPIEELIQFHEAKETTANPPTLEVRTTQWTITPAGKPVFDERAITLSIEDEAGGEFLTIKNGDDSNGGSFRFDPEEWPTLRALIDEAIKGVRK